VSHLFREVDEEVRRDRAIRLWRRYWKFVVAGAFLAILAAAAVVGWREYQEAQLRADGERFNQALSELEAGQAAAAADSFAGLASEGTAGYAVLARLREAEALVKAGDKEAAVVVYDRLADDGGADDVYRELAALYAAQLRIDKAPLDEIEQRLAPLATSGTPWRFLAQELLAVANLRAGRTEAARAALAGLAQDPELPFGSRRRVNELLATLGGP
jgi:hypothetical protein